MVSDSILDYNVKLIDGSYILSIHSNGKIIETDLGSDEDVAQGKTKTLVDGLYQAVDTILNGMMYAYGEAVDSQELVDAFAKDISGTK
jgi:hypothetical protein